MSPLLHPRKRTQQSRYVQSRNVSPIFFLLSNTQANNVCYSRIVGQVVYFVPTGSSEEAQTGMVTAALAALARASPLYSLKSSAAASAPPASVFFAVSDGTGALTCDVIWLGSTKKNKPRLINEIFADAISGASADCG
jgi:hypothetical protein